MSLPAGAQRNLLLQLVGWFSLALGPLTIFDASGPLLGVSPYEALLLPGIGAWLLTSGFTGRPYVGKHTHPLAFMLALGYSFVAVLLNGGFTDSDVSLWPWLGLCYRFLLVKLILDSLAVLPMNLVRCVRMLAYVNLSVAVFGTIIIIRYSDIYFFRVGIYQAHDALSQLLQYTAYRNPNVLSRFLILTLPFCIFEILYGRAGFPKWLALCNVPVLFSAQSRVALLLLFMQTFVVLMLMGRRRGLMLPRFALVATVILAGWLIIGQARFSKVVNQYDQLGTTVRLELARGAFEAIRDRPLIGWGPGGSTDAIDRDYRISHVMTGIGRHDHVHLTLHNTLLLLAVEYGVPVATMYCLGVLAVLGTCVRRALRLPRGRERDFLLVVSIAVFSQFISGMSATNFEENIGWYAFSLMMFTASLPTAGLAQRLEYASTAPRRTQQPISSVSEYCPPLLPPHSLKLEGENRRR